MATVTEHMDGATRAASAKVEAELRRKAGQMQKFLDDVEELLGRVSSMDEPDISRLRHKVESSIQHVKDSVSEGAHAAIKGTRDAAIATDEYVHRNPWIAIGAGAAAGMLVGALLRGNRH